MPLVFTETEARFQDSAPCRMRCRYSSCSRTARRPRSIFGLHLSPYGAAVSAAGCRAQDCRTSCRSPRWLAPLVTGKSERYGWRNIVVLDSAN